MLSRTAEYALRAVLFMARRPDASPVSADEIATALDAPANYLSKTLNALAKARILRSTRGPRGGFALAVSPEELTIARIAEAFEVIRPSGMCLLGATRCDPTHPCAAHERWTSITAESRRPLETTTIAQILGDERRRRPVARLA